MARVKELCDLYGKSEVCLYIEDARQRKWFKGGREKAQEWALLSAMRRSGKTGAKRTRSTIS